jgi:hypothetical protein
MTRFLELKKKYESLVDGEEGYWLDLHDTAKEILEGFCTYLGLPEPEVEGNGKWVHFGGIGFEGFERCDFTKLERHNNLLHFALLLNLSLEPTQRPKSQHILSLRICKVGTKYQVSSTDAAIYPSPCSRGEYDQLFSKMYENLEKALAV